MTHMMSDAEERHYRTLQQLDNAVAGAEARVKALKETARGLETAWKKASERARGLDLPARCALSINMHEAAAMLEEADRLEERVCKTASQFAYARRELEGAKVALDAYRRNATPPARSTRKAVNDGTSYLVYCSDCKQLSLVQSEAPCLLAVMCPNCGQLVATVVGTRMKRDD